MGCSLSSGKPCVLVLGGPCCGKTTQCAKIAKDFGYNHLSAAELVRNEMNKGTDVGKQCDHLIQDGEPMPLHLVLGVLKQAINKDVNSKGFLIDGFPRGNGQAKELISAFERKIGRPKMVFFLDCPRDVMEKRAVKRAEEGGAGAPAEDVNKKVALAFEADEAKNIPIINFYEEINPEMVKRVSLLPSHLNEILAFHSKSRALIKFLCILWLLISWNVVHSAKLVCSSSERELLDTSLPHSSNKTS